MMIFKHTRPSEKSFYWKLFILISLQLLAYYAVINNDFVWDDETYVYQYPYIREFSWSGAFFGHFLNFNYYRPLPLLTFALDYVFSGGQPWLFHLTNLLFHIVNTVLVVFLAQRVIIRYNPTATRNLALLAGLFYGLHPVLVEPVAWISGRFDLMVTLFLLLALLLDGLPSLWKRSFGVGLCFFLAALCKEMAVAFPVILVFWHLALADHPAQGQRSLGDYWRYYRNSGHLWTYLALLVAGLAYLGLRYVALGYLLQPTVEVDKLGEPLQHLLLVAKALGLYLSLIVWPFTQLSPLHEQVYPVPLTDTSAWIALLVITSLFIAWFRWVNRYPLVFWLGLAFFISLAPIIHLVPLPIHATIVHERFLTFPLALFTLLVAGVIEQVRPVLIREFIPRWRLPGIGIATLAILWFSLSLVNIRVTVPLWETNFRLWSWAVQKEPESDYAKGYLMQIYAYHDIEKARELFSKMKKLDIYNWKTYGLILIREEKYQDAIELYEELVAFLPENGTGLSSTMLAAGIYNNLGLCYLKTDNITKAEESFSKAISINPYLPEVYINLSGIYAKKGQLSEAKRVLDLSKKYGSPFLNKNLESYSKSLEDLIKKENQISSEQVK